MFRLAYAKKEFSADLTRPKTGRQDKENYRIRNSPIAMNHNNFVFHVIRIFLLCHVNFLTHKCT